MNIGLAVILAPGYQAVGMACAVLATETFVTGSMYLLLRWRKLDPLTCACEPASRVA
jgi:hypothetical protein